MKYISVFLTLALLLNCPYARAQSDEVRLERVTMREAKQPWGYNNLRFNIEYIKNYSNYYTTGELYILAILSQQPCAQNAWAFILKLKPYDYDLDKGWLGPLEILRVSDENFHLEDPGKQLSNGEYYVYLASIERGRTIPNHIHSLNHKVIIAGKNISFSAPDEYVCSFASGYQYPVNKNWSTIDW